MKFMSLWRPSKVTPPTGENMAQMGQLIDMVKKGVMIETGGWYPDAPCTAFRSTGGKLTVTDGPFTEAKEIIAGFCLMNVKSRPRPSSGPLASSRSPGTGSARSASSMTERRRTVQWPPCDRRSSDAGQFPHNLQRRRPCGWRVLMMRLWQRRFPGPCPIRAVAPMMAYNETLQRPALLLALDGLTPSSQRAQVSFADGKAKVTDGPFSRDQGSSGRLLDAPGQVQGGSSRVGQALPSRPWGRPRNPPGSGDERLSGRRAGDHRQVP